MSRKIILCFDGTGNEIGVTKTNVLKLYKGLRDDRSQLKHYVPGIGTLEGPRLVNSTLVRNTRSLLGLAFGRGLENDVLGAYSFLCKNYQDGLGAGHHGRDRIYIFGFSRGAYAARVLAGFIYNFGLLKPERLHLVAEVFRAYRQVTETERGPDDSVTFAKLRAYGEVLRPKVSVPIRALGLFDTVASMVRFHKPLKTLWETGSIIELGTHANVVENPSIRIVLQALAVDERRSMFRPLLWKGTDYYPNRFPHEPNRRTQYLKQRWFSGFHSDIGGSTGANAEIGKLTLSWMLDALAQAELKADQEDAFAKGRKLKKTKGFVLNAKFKRENLCLPLPHMPSKLTSKWHNPYAMAPIHPSMSMGWMPLEYMIPKTRARREWPHPKSGLPWYLPQQEPRNIPTDHEIDDSVFSRMAGHATYRPINVLERRKDQS